MSAAPGGTPGSGKVSLLFRLALRFLQLVFALAVAGLYGIDLDNARKMGKYADRNWVYAEVIAGLSAITCLIFMIPLIKSWIFFIWDAVLFVLWAAVLGVFGRMYINLDPKGDGGIRRMKNAVWVDLINMCLWFVTAAYGGGIYLYHRRQRTLHTGRAVV